MKRLLQMPLKGSKAECQHDVPVTLYSLPKRFPHKQPSVFHLQGERHLASQAHTQPAPSLPPGPPPPDKFHSMKIHWFQDGSPPPDVVPAPGGQQEPSCPFSSVFPAGNTLVSSFAPTDYDFASSYLLLGLKGVPAPGVEDFWGAMQYEEQEAQVGHSPPSGDSARNSGCGQGSGIQEEENS